MSSTAGANASQQVFAVNPNGYVTIIPAQNMAMWLPFYPLMPIGGHPASSDKSAKQSRITIGNAEGYECSECQEFYPMAELNQPDNVDEFTIFTCYSCRKGLKTFFKKNTGELK